VDRYLDEIKEAVVTGKHTEIEALVKNAIDENVDLNSLLNDALIAAMDVVSGKFSRNEIFVPEMLLCAVTMKKALEIVKPRLQDGKATARGTIIMCTVKGDLHDIGKNLVGMFLEGAGFDVVDLGVDVSAEQVIEKVLELKPKIIGLSTLLTTTMTEMGKTLEQLEKDRAELSSKDIPEAANYNTGLEGNFDTFNDGRSAHPRQECGRGRRAVQPPVDPGSTTTS